jgi:hypothetical protein
MQLLVFQTLGGEPSRQSDAPLGCGEVMGETIIDVSELTHFGTAEDGTAVRIKCEDTAGRAAFIAMSVDCLGSLGMTIPRMLSTALQRRFKNPAMRMTYPLSSFVLEIGLDRSTRILTLEALDGFQVSFSLSGEQCREIGEAEPQEPENRLARHQSLN